LNYGDRVFHHQLGWGTVKRVLQKGSKEEVWVDFGYTKEYLPPEELQSSGLQPKPGSAPELGSQGAKSNVAQEENRLISEGNDGACPLTGTLHLTFGSQTDARRGVIALRLGQILESQVYQLSVGTQELEARLKGQVEMAVLQRPSFVLVEGAWGGGKTHALTLLKAIAGAAGLPRPA